MTTLTKSQTKQFSKSLSHYHGKPAELVATVRYDDKCGNGHNTFSITAEVRVDGVWQAGGCLHDLVAEHFPELGPLVKWHLVSSDGPLHYPANALYHALEHGATHAWVYFTGPSDPLGIGGSVERLLGYEKAEVAKTAEGVDGYRVLWDEKTVKASNLDAARSCAVWPEATDEQLKAADLKEQLAARLPALMAEFRLAVESLGFVY